MLHFVFGVEDLARLRLAISPAWELVHSLVALREPSLAALHVPWLRTLDGALGDIDVRSVIPLVPARGYSPDFLTPPPRGPLGDIEDELATIRATPIREVRREMAIFRRVHRAVKIAEPWLEHPRRELNRLCDTLEAFWERALAPVWPRVRALLEADVAHRARQLTTGGPADLFDDLHQEIRWAGDRASVGIPFDGVEVLDGRGLLLMPSAFAWLRPWAITLAPWQPTVVYPARGVATLWEDEPPAPGGLSPVLGRTRASMLVALAAPVSTTELARRLSVTPGAISQHLTALRAAGLVTSRREGRSVLYVRTPTADALVAGAERP